MGDGTVLKLSWHAFGQRAKALAVEIEQGLDGRKLDLIVGIARGGVPVAQVVADRLNVRMATVTAQSYTGIGERGEPKITEPLKRSLRGKNILIVDDLVDHGHTLKAVVRHVEEKRAKSVLTATLFHKPWSTFMPTFPGESTSAWVVFPWDEHEYKRLTCDKTAVPA